MLDSFVNGFYAGFYICGAMLLPLLILVAFGRLSRLLLKNKIPNPKQFAEMVEQVKRANPGVRPAPPIPTKPR